MSRRVILAREAVEDLKRLRAYDRARVTDALRTLRDDPARTGRTRIKRLRGLARPQYRMRVGEIRVFYDVRPGVVQILAIVAKEEAEEWLEREGRKS